MTTHTMALRHPGSWRGRSRRLGPPPPIVFTDAERADLDAANDAIRAASERRAELGRRAMTAPGCESDEAWRAYHASGPDGDRTVDHYVAVERAAIIRCARARETRPAPVRRVCHARRLRRSRPRARRSRVRATADPDGEPYGSRHHLSSEVVP